jgi:DNA-binding LytR/AlgR family response regulator
MKDDFLFINSERKLHKVNIGAISFIQAMDDYIKIHLKDSKYLITRMTMKVMLKQLDRQEFVRVHRSFIVPVKSIEALGVKNILVDGNEISLGKNYAEDVRERFKEYR